MKKVFLKLIFFAIVIFFALSPIYSQDSSEWYKPQFGTGFAGNCGPASAAMAIEWSTGIEISVERVRNYIGWPQPDGGVSLYDVLTSLLHYGANASYYRPESLEDILNVLDEGSLIIFLYPTDVVSVSDGSQYGRTYEFNGGHYSVIRDYYGDFFVVNDPMPDGIDRLYAIDEIYKCLELVIVVEKVYNY